jgi:hypothetical protein
MPAKIDVRPGTDNNLVTGVDAYFHFSFVNLLLEISGSSIFILSMNNFYLDIVPIRHAEVEHAYLYYQYHLGIWILYIFEFI